jgi:hypothetical protein
MQRLKALLLLVVFLVAFTGRIAFRMQSSPHLDVQTKHQVERAPNYHFLDAENNFKISKVKRRNHGEWARHLITVLPGGFLVHLMPLVSPYPPSVFLLYAIGKKHSYRPPC